MLAAVVSQLMPLLKAADETALDLAGLQLWCQHVRAVRGWYLRLSFDGRELQVMAQLERGQVSVAAGLSFNCTQFDQPFSHVAFSAKSIVLQQLAQSPELSHPQYLTWIASASAQTELWVEPLYLNGKLQGLWATQAVAGQTYQSSDTQAIKQLMLLRIEQLQQDRHIQVNHTSLVSSLNALHADVLTGKHKKILAQTIIGESEQIQKLQDKIIIAARSQLSVLVQGETGVGKELVAKAIHQLSDREQRPFIALNCAAIPDSLLESELFGFVKGAFSGATHCSKGLLGQSDSGVLFLDEIGDMPLTIQAKLLRVLETRKYRQLGGSEELSCDFRLITATHHHLPLLIKQQRFRSDLFYRLNSFPILVVPLRERKADIELLSQYFIDQHNCANQCRVLGISEAAIEQLNTLSFNGNIRELKNIIELACVHCSDGEEIHSIDLSNLEFPSAADSEELDSQSPAELTHKPGEISNLKAAVEQFEEQIIKQRLLLCGGNKSKAAQTLGVPRRTFTYICQRLELNNSE